MVMHFVGVVVTDFWTSTSPRENRTSIDIWSKELVMLSGVQGFQSKRRDIPKKNP